MGFMTVDDAVKILDGTYFTGEELGSLEFGAVHGADLMSDVISNIKDKALLLTGLVNPQVVRTAELLDIRAIIFVRGKIPGSDMIDMAKDSGIILANTKLPMFFACGKIYEAAIHKGGGLSAE
jgi:hypothetical protein